MLKHTNQKKMETLKLKKTIKIDVVSDVACPWCYIGKKRLEGAIEELNKDFNFEVTFLPFQLDPTIPAEGINGKEYFENKFGSADRVETLHQRVELAGEGVGVHFKFREIPVIPNTLLLHVILKAAKKENIQLPVANALFDAYMVHPKNMAEKNTLAEIMFEFGWATSKTLALLEDENLIKEVKAEIEHAKRLGVNGVPFFIINDKYGVSGAQPQEVFVQAFKSLKEEDFPLLQGESCDVDGNC